MVYTFNAGKNTKRRTKYKYKEIFQIVSYLKNKKFKKKQRF